MSHLYQPLVIRTLLESGGRASVREIAREFLSYDEAQVEYYIRIVKRWPKITLTKHGVIDASERDYFRLTIDVASLSDAQRADILTICNDRIRNYISNYKGIIGDYRYNPDDLSSSSLRYLVLKLANGRCALCGASVRDTPIDVDHIIPRSRGGSNDLSNLQALCFRCNRAKRDRDSQDFRILGTNDFQDGCLLCEIGDQSLFEYNTARCVRDNQPVTRDHSILVPRRHVPTVSDLSAAEVTDLFELTKVVRSTLQAADSTISGFNLGFDEGLAAGQVVPHVHMHLVPRRSGDTLTPTLGAREVLRHRI